MVFTDPKASKSADTGLEFSSQSYNSLLLCVNQNKEKRHTSRGSKMSYRVQGSPEAMENR